MWDIMRPIDMELQKISDTKKVWDIMHPTDMMVTDYNCTFIFEIISSGFFFPTRPSVILSKRVYIFCSLLDPQQHRKGSKHLVE